MALGRSSRHDGCNKYQFVAGSCCNPLQAFPCRTSTRARLMPHLILQELGKCLVPFDGVRLVPNSASNVVYSAAPPNPSMAGMAVLLHNSLGIHSMSVFPSILARARNQPLTNNEATRYSTLAGSPARPTGCHGPSREQELLWRAFFLDPSLWWDIRQHKKSSHSPDFRQRDSQDVLWLNDIHKPAWVDSQLAALDVQMERHAPTTTWGVPNGAVSIRSAGYGLGVTAETVRKLCNQGQLDEAVEVLGVLVHTDCDTYKPLFHIVLRECVAKKDLPLGRRVHALVVKKGFESDTFMCNYILRMYASNARLQEAMDVFSMVAQPDVFTWSAIISANVKHGQDKQAVQLYQQMRRSGVKPTGHVFVAALQACARGADLKSGLQVHAEVLASGFQADLFVSSCLVDMYAKCGSLEDARRVFDGLLDKDVVIWNAMIAGYSQHHKGQEAFRLYGAMQEEGIVGPNSVTFLCLLQACASVGTSALRMGRQLHEQMRELGLQADVYVASSLINMYAKCGSVEEARSMFDGLVEKNVVTWNAMIVGYAQQGMGQEALVLYRSMQDDMAVPDSVTFVALLQACAGVGPSALEKGKELHALISERGLQVNVFAANSLVNMYAKCGDLEAAQGVFEGLAQKDVVTWNAMIAGYFQQNMGQEALGLYRAMQEDGMTAPDSVTFVSVLQACALLGAPALESGKQLHAQIRENGLQSDVFVANSLVNMYAKCGSVEHAQAVFDGLGKRTLVTWSALIAGYCQQGMGEEALHLYGCMQQEGFVPDAVTFVCLLNACARLGVRALERGKQLHAHLVGEGLQANLSVANSLVNMYAKCGSLEDARAVFEGLSQKDVVTWNAMIAGYCCNDMGQEALGLYEAMQDKGTAAPDSVTFVCLLQACASVGTRGLETGKQLHAQIRIQGVQAQVVVGGSLVNMYAKCGVLNDARNVFDGLDRKDVVTWNAMIAAYSQQGMGHEALSLYTCMQEEGMAAPDAVTFASLLRACANLGTTALEKGKQLHAQVGERNLQADVFVANSLVNMYAKCGSLVDAQGVFDQLTQKDVVTWNAMISAYSQEGMVSEALVLLSAMQEEGMAAPDSVTFVSLLQACAIVGNAALEKGRQIHAHIKERGLQADVFVTSSLINMYAKSGSLEDARDVFDGLGKKDAMALNAMIAGYTRQGMGEEALHIYRAMQEAGCVAPNSVTYVCLLQACASSAALHLGRELHAQIKGQGLEADALVAGSLINMYAKCGSMVDARQVFEELPERDIVAWSALIAGYSRQGDQEELFDLVDRMKEDGTQLDGITFLSLLTVCSHTGLVKKGQDLFEDMSDHYGITPKVDHYTCMVDLLGRAGLLDEALALVRTMPVLPDSAVWRTLLAACQKWGNVPVGRHAFDEAVKLDKKDAAAYVLMFNIYTGAQMWEQAHEMQLKRQEIRAWKRPGQSWWTDMDGLVHGFLVGAEPRPGSGAKLQQLAPGEGGVGQRD